MKLTPKQEKFCEEYMIDLNGSAAAVRAGYSKKTARQIAELTLKKPHVQAYIQQKKASLQEKTGITQERILNEYAKIAFFDIRKIYTVDGGLKNVSDFGDDEAGAVIAIETYDESIEGEVVGTTKKIKIADKKGALDSLAKHLGMFEDHNKQKKPVFDLSQMAVTFK